MAMRERDPYKGLAKVRKPPLCTPRHVVLFNASEGLWRELFDRADVMSEGETLQEAKSGDADVPSRRSSAFVYYGSTSVVVPIDALGTRPLAGFDHGEQHISELIRIMAHDPHLRLRALRVAHREAQARATGPLGPLRAEVRIAPSARGIVFTIDVSAPVVVAKVSSPAR